MSQLPSGWAHAQLSSIADTQLGKMLSAKAKGGAEPRPYLRNKNVQWGRIDTDDLFAMDFGSDELHRFEVLNGDLLVCEGGEVGRAAIWRGQLDWVGFQKALHRIRPAAGMAPEFLLYCFMWLAQSHALDRHVTGSTIKHLPQEDLRQIQIPVPPLAEQRRIVAAIEEHLSRLDAADSSLAAAYLRLAGLRSAALADSFRGDYELRPLLDVTDGSRPICYGILKPKTTGELVVPYVEVRSIVRGRIDVSSLHRTTQALHHEFRRSELKGGDVVLAIRGSYDRAAVVPDELTGANVSRDVARVAPGAGLDSRFLAHFLASPTALQYYSAAARGVGVRGVNIGDLRTMPIPVPQLDEQHRIVAEIEMRVSAIEAIQAEIERARLRSRALRRALLDRAFRGELVPQDPSEEPASSLLNGIAAARARAEDGERHRPRRRATMRRT